MQESSNKQAAEDLIQQSLNREAMKRERFTQILPFVGIVLLVTFFTLTTGGRFVAVENLKLLLNQCFTMAIVMVGAIFLYSLGSLDMAIGQVLGAASLVLAVLYNLGLPILFCLLAGILVSVGFMCITATAKNYLKLNPFIASLCVSNISSGIVVAVTKQGKITFPYSKAPWLNNTSTKVLVLIALILIGYVLYNYTGFGKSLKAIGGSPVVARISGVKVEKVTYLAYILIGVMIGISALFTVSRSGAVDPSVGSSMNLNVMIAIVLGGFPLSGGANARFSAPLIGALMVTVLTNGLAMMGQANALGYGIKGLLFIIVVALTYEKSKGKLID
ncbi:ABC transporter permease [Diplocloster modestus]|uniref:ABC transporter permease n=1 Tax=Diplocloster modestus TaxID=2850322 RepID=A0ABS6K6N0_9FIRM|nr:ABC transporter permease [Diplocloster modestus]MBU9726196.1 ABC transporter permease [Diplocloster modestus]